MKDAATKVLDALLEGELTEQEIAVNTLLAPTAVNNGLRNLLREGRVVRQDDNGVWLWRRV